MQYGRPIADITVGGWGTPPLWDKIDEVTPDDAATQVQTGNNPSNDPCEVRLLAVNDPLIDSGHTLRVRAYTTGSGNLTYGLYQGTTQIASQTSVLGGAYATFAINLTPEQIGAITNYADLRVRLTANGSSGRIRVTWIELEVPDSGYFAELGPKLNRFYLERDVLLRSLGNVVYVLPPYCTTRSELDRIYDVIDDSLALGRG